MISRAEHQAAPSAPLNIWLVVATAFISIVGLSFQLPLFDLDEGAFTSATREMLETGNWVSTYMNGVPRHDKPILIYWLQAMSVSTFGMSEFSLRLPSMIAAGLWLWVVFRFLRLQADDETAKYWVIVFGCMPLASLIFKAATADALLNLFLTAACLEVYLYLATYGKFSDKCTPLHGSHTAHLFRIGLIFGLGFLTKGPVAVVIPAAVSLLFCLTYGWSLVIVWLRCVINPVILVTFLAIITPWHIASYLDQGWAFFEGFYLKHNVSRFSETMEQHGGNPFYYLVILPFLLLPVFGVFVASLRNALKFWQSPLGRFCWIWFAIVLTLFSFSQTQLPHYLLYGLPPLLILIALELKHAGKLSVLFAGLAVALFAAIPLALDNAVESTKADFDKGALALASQTFDQGFIWLVLAAFALAVFIWLPKALNPLSCVHRVLLGCFGCTLVFNFLLMPVVGAGQQAPIQEAVAEAKK
ncbi:MAG: ArnT family glycosyltransferase, partial [Pontibacterium sp.]